MTFPATLTTRPARCRIPGSAGFTLPEMLIASSLLVLLLGGMVVANLFGLRMMQATQTKLDTSDRARKALGRMSDEIRNCKSAWIGDVSNGVFVARLDGESQLGSGVLIYPGTNATNFVVYYVNDTDKTFRRISTSPVTATILMRSVTNAWPFSAQDYQGQLLTNNQNNHVIHLKLESYQAQPQTPVGDYYQIETAVTRRAVE